MHIHLKYAVYFHILEIHNEKKQHEIFTKDLMTILTMKILATKPVMN